MTGGIVAIDGAGSEIPAVTDDRAAKKTERPARRAAGEKPGRNGLTSEGSRDPSELPMAEEFPVQAAGTLLEDQVVSEPYKLLDGTDTGSPSATPGRAPWSAVTAAR